MVKPEIAGYRTIDAFVNAKVKKLFELPTRNFSTLYDFMFSERTNVMAEKTDGHRIIRTTYGECRTRIEKLANALRPKLEPVPNGEIVGLYMDNSLEWIEFFWAILKSGNVPLLMNMRLDDERLETVLKENNVKAVISDSKKFNCTTLDTKELLEAAEESSDTPPADEVWADEIIVMSSGTSLSVKLCGYNGENFAYQIQDSAKMIAKCKQAEKHYNGKLKLLVFLPLYHIFGLVALYIWFGFFSRTLVFLKDLDPETILYTIKRHEVTHIFAVPLFWNKVYAGAYAKIAERGEKTFNKFKKGLEIAKKTGSKLFSKLAFGEVRDNLFGDSVQFLVTGGGAISPDVISFFNGIGYHMFNGYGMSEVGLTSIELTTSVKVRNSGSVGSPFSHIEYSINADGELLVRGKSTASRIIQNGEVWRPNGQWYNTHDLVREEKGRYYILGRKDDMLVGENGENINPDWIESKLNIDGALANCLVGKKTEMGIVPTLIVQVNKYCSEGRGEEIKARAEAELTRLGLNGAVRSIVLTGTPLIAENEFKLNRRRLSAALTHGELSLVGGGAAAEQTDDKLHAKVRELFAEALRRDQSEIGDGMNFFFDLGGTSLDYYSLVTAVRNEFGVNLPVSEQNSITTVSQFCEYINSNI